MNGKRARELRKLVGKMITRHGDDLPDKEYGTTHTDKFVPGQGMVRRSTTFLKKFTKRAWYRSMKKAATKGKLYK